MYGIFYLIRILLLMSDGNLGGDGRQPRQFLGSLMMPTPLTYRTTKFGVVT